MIIKATTPTGKKTKLFHPDGKQELRCCELDTERCEATLFVSPPSGNPRRCVPDGKGGFKKHVVSARGWYYIDAAGARHQL